MIHPVATTIVADHPSFVRNMEELHPVWQCGDPMALGDCFLYYGFVYEKTYLEALKQKEDHRGFRHLWRGLDPE